MGFGYDGACGSGRCGDRNCSDCDGNNYPAISSAFSSVPDNFNSVTNFVPKFPVYSILRVAGKATENVACNRSSCGYEKDDESLFRDSGRCCEPVESLGTLFVLSVSVLFTCF